MGAPFDGLNVLLLLEIIGLFLFLGLTALISGVVFLFATGTAKTVAGIVLAVSGGIIALPIVVLAVEEFFSSITDSISDSFSEWSEVREFKKELTPLMRAVEKNDVKKVRKLLKKGENPNESAKGYTALSLACLDDENDKSNEIIILLLDSGADANLVPLDEDSGKPVSFRRTVFTEKRNPGSNNYQPDIPASPLYFAIQGNRYSAVKSLISHGVDLSGNENNNPACVQPIQLAMLNQDYEEMTLLLLENGVKPEHQFCSYTYPHKTLIMQLFQKSEMKSLEANVSILKKFIELGFDLNVTYDYGQTALYYAAEAISEGRSQFDVPLASILLESGADVNLASKSGTTPLIIAVESRNQMEHILSAVELLCSHGADITLKNNAGRRALDVFLLYFPEPDSNFSPDEVEKYHRIIELLTPKTSEKNSEWNNAPVVAKVDVQTPQISEKDTFQERPHIELFDMIDNW